MTQYFAPISATKLGSSSPILTNSDALTDYVKWMIQCNIPFRNMEQSLHRQAFAKWGLAHPSRGKAAAVREELFEAVRSAISERIKLLDHIALTTDGWTGPTASFWSVTVQGLDADFHLHAYRLGCVPIFASVHNAPTLVDEITKVLETFAIDPSKVCSVTTDEGGAAPLIASGFSESVFEIHCSAHVLNTALRNGFKAAYSKHPFIWTVFKACKEVTAITKRSTLISEQLTVQQLEHREPLIQLEQEVATRWNSILACLSSVYSCKKSVEALCTAHLKDIPASDVIINLSAQFWPLVKCLIIILEWFEEASLKTSVESRITAHETAFQYYRLRGRLLCAEDLLNKSVNAESAKNSDLKACQAAKAVAVEAAFILADHLKVKMAPTPAEKIALALHPGLPAASRCSSVAVKLEWQADLEEAFQHIKAMGELGLEEPTTDFRSGPPVDEDWLDPPENPLAAASVRLDVEIPAYRLEVERLQARGLVPNFDLAAYWSIATRFPGLRALARRYLTFPATQVASKRDFSATRLICTHLRSRLDPKTIYKLSVIRPYLKLTEKAVPAPRSASNIQADAARVESRKRKREQVMKLRYEGIKVARLTADSPIRQKHAADRVDQAAAAIDESDTEVDDGERSSDGDYGDEPAEMVHNGYHSDGGVESAAPAPVTRYATGTKAAYCEVTEVDTFFYIATFYNMKGHDIPPTEHIFGKKDRMLTDWGCAAPVDYQAPTFPYRCFRVSAKGLKHCSSSKQFLRLLGEIHSFKIIPN